MKRKFILFFLILFLFFSCKHEKNKYIVVATEPSRPPMVYIDENTKEIIGFEVDLFNAIAKISNLKLEYKNVPWDGIFDRLIQDEYDAIICSTTINEERKEKADFSIPYINAGQVIITKSDDNSIKNLKDLQGKNIGAQIDTTGAYFILKMDNVTLNNYDEVSYAIDALRNDKIDAVICDYPVASYYVMKSIKYKNVFKIVTEPFTEEYYGIVVKKGNKKLLSKINSGLSELINNGTIKKLEKKWLN